MRRRARAAPLRAAAVVIVSAVAFFALPAALAVAHAGLTASDPAEGSSVKESPQKIVMTFAEKPDATLSLVKVIDSSGRFVPGVSDPEPVSGKPGNLQITLSEALSEGVYTVNWRSVSAVDGHVESGAFAFGVGVTPAPGSERTVVLLHTSAWADRLGVGGRWLLCAGLALLVGAAAACLFAFGGAVPLGGARLAYAALLVAAAGLALMVWSARDLVGAPSLLPLFVTPEGKALLYLGLALAVCAVTAVAVDLYPGRAVLWALGAVALVAVLVHVLAGHADATSSWRYLNLAVQWVHMSAVGVWVGGLAWLLLGIRGMERPERVAAVRRFSLVATVTLVVVLVTGAARGLVEVGTPSNLFTTAYGVALLVKVGLVVVLVALGALNHYRWVPALGTRDGAARSFRLNSGGELALAAGVLLATAVLSGLAPASSAVATTSAVPQGVTATGSDYATTVRVSFTAAPGAPGRNEYLVRVDGHDSGEPLTGVASVKLEFSLPDDPTSTSARGSPNACRSQRARVTRGRGRPNGGEVVLATVGAHTRNPACAP